MAKHVDRKTRRKLSNYTLLLFIRCKMAYKNVNAGVRRKL
jgi:hypothetical protein